MNEKLTCSQVASIINLYIEGKLNPTLQEYVALHIENCPHCKQKIEELQNILKKYDHKHCDENEKTSVCSDLRNNLSAYIDNELEYKENIKIKKYTISNSDARKELEGMYKFQKLLRSSYEHTKRNLKKDYSKNIIAEVVNEEYSMTEYFKKLVILFATIIIVIISGFIYLYF